MNKTLTPAQQQLITNDLIRYAQAMAYRYSGRGVDIDDLKQEACCGLCEAAQHYKEGSTASFLTFSTFYVRKYIVNAIGILSFGIELSVDEENGAEMLEDDEAQDELLAFADDEDAGDAEEEDLPPVEELLSVLTPRERKDIELTFGLRGDEPLSVIETAKVLGLKTETVRGAYERALNKMECYK